MNSDFSKIQASKNTFRRDLAAKPVAEKLKLLDAMRERELAIRASKPNPDSASSSLHEEPAASGQVNSKAPATPMAHPRDPLHGITLESILNQLVQRHGWSEMARRIQIRCFMFNPTIRSSLTFLRKNPWARQKVEDWFIREL
jgi:hypothetical protein